MPKPRIIRALHPNTTDTTQAYVWSLANYCAGDCFPWLLLTPTQVVHLAREGRLTLLALLETSAEDMAAITGCAAEAAAELVRRVAEDGAYWTGPEFAAELSAMPGDIEAAGISYDALRRECPEYREPSNIELLPEPCEPFPWPQGPAWNRPMSSIIVGQFEDGGHEIRNLLCTPEEHVPGRHAYLTDPHVITKYEARRGEIKRDLERLAEDAKTYDLAAWLRQELRFELQDIESYLLAWLPPRQRLCDI